MAAKRVHLVCNAHLDPVWQWEWEEGIAAAISTFRTSADFCDEYDGFIFNHNEAILYQWVEENEPELFARIQRLVREGKWHIMGGWHLQPDCNMPSGESFVRQILLGKTYFKEKFGVEPTTAINFDPFGHSRGIAQILAKSGYDSYLFCRPGGGDMHLESDQFVWVGFDGSEIIATRSPSYNNSIGTARQKVEEHLEGWKDSDCSIVLWGIGDHGGGPSRIDMENLIALMNERKDFEIVHSTPEVYFAELAKKKDTLPRRENDLNPWGVGCYTSQIRIKQKHRLLENEIYFAEKMCSAAAVQGLVDYPAKEIQSALMDLATGEFHDILPGSSVQSVEDLALRLLDHGLETIGRIKSRAFFALASGQPPVAEGEIPVLVYNPHPFKVRIPVEFEFQLTDIKWGKQFTAATVYAGEAQLPCQHEKEASNLPLDWRKRVVFLADLEPGQMNRFDCKLEELPEKPAPALKPSGDKIVFKTPDMEAIISTKTGLMESYKAGGVEYIGANAFQPLVIKDNEDPWGMTTHSYREVAGAFELMDDERSARFSGVKSDKLPAVRIIEDGAVRSVVESVLSYYNSAIVLQYLLPKEGAEVEVRVRVFWNEKDRMLKLSVPVSAGEYNYIGQTAFGVQELPANGDEAVAQKWTAVVSRDGSRALTCINDCIYASDFSEDGLHLTLLRSPGYCAHPIHDYTILPQDRFLPRIDQGERTYRFWLNGGAASERLERVDREALVRNEKPLALSFFPSGLGKMPKQFVTLSDDAVQMSAAKFSEDGKALIIRLFEPTGKERVTTLSIPAIDIKQEITLRPFEIKTLRIDLKSKEIAETGLLEN